MHCSFEKQPTLPIVPATVDVRPVAPDARRRPAGPARRDRRERRGRESDQDRKRRRRREEREEDYHLKRGKGRLRREEAVARQPKPHSTRKWRQSAAMAAAPHYFLHRLRGYRRTPWPPVAPGAAADAAVHRCQ